LCLPRPCLPHNLHSKFMRQLLSIFDLMTIIVIIFIKLPAVRCFFFVSLSLSLSLCVPPAHRFLAKLMPCFLPHFMSLTAEKPKCENSKSRKIKAKEEKKKVGYLCVFVAHEFRSMLHSVGGASPCLPSCHHL